MINLNEYLNTVDKSNVDTPYYLVTWDNHTEPTYFQHYKDSYFPSPCELYQINSFDNEEEFLLDYKTNYLPTLLEDTCEGSINEYVEKFVKPCIVNNKLYEVENFQCFPYLPEEVDAIKLIDEHECILWMLNNCKKENKNE